MVSLLVRCSCCLLFAVVNYAWLLVVVRCLLTVDAVSHMLFVVVCGLLFVVCCSLFVVCCLIRVVCCCVAVCLCDCCLLLVVAACLLLFDCCCLFVG